MPRRRYKFYPRFFPQREQEEKPSHRTTTHLHLNHSLDFHIFLKDPLAERAKQPRREPRYSPSSLCSISSFLQHKEPMGDSTNEPRYTSPSFLIFSQSPLPLSPLHEKKNWRDSQLKNNSNRPLPHTHAPPLSLYLILRSNHWQKEQENLKGLTTSRPLCPLSLTTCH